MIDLTEFMQEESKEIAIYKDINKCILEIEDLKIENDENYDFCAEWLKRNKETQKIVNDFFEPEKKSLNEKKNKLMADIKRYLKPLEETESVVKKMMSEYYFKQEAIRQKKIMIANEEKRRQEEEIRLKAIELANSGKTIESIEKLEEVKYIHTEIIEDAKRNEGISFQEIWKYEIIDIEKIPRSFLIPDEKKIAGYARLQKEKANIDGIRFFCEQIVKARS